MSRLRRRWDEGRESIFTSINHRVTLHPCETFHYWLWIGPRSDAQFSGSDLVGVPFPRVCGHVRRSAVRSNTAINNNRNKQPQLGLLRAHGVKRSGAIEGPQRVFDLFQFSLHVVPRHPLFAFFPARLVGSPLRGIHGRDINT